MGVIYIVNSHSKSCHIIGSRMWDRRSLSRLFSKDGWQLYLRVRISNALSGGVHCTIGNDNDGRT